jgi:H(+)-translocating pyrophosphatase
LDNYQYREISLEKLINISDLIALGANAFLWAEYRVMAVFLVAFAILILIMVGTANNCGIPTYYRVDLLTSKIDVASCHDSSGATKLAVGCGWHKEAGSCWGRAGFTTVAFLLGAIASIVSGFLGMKIAVYSNVRTAVCCITSWTKGFNTAFRAGSVMGFSLVSIAVLSLITTIGLFNLAFPWNDPSIPDAAEVLFEVVTGFGLGGSAVALFGRVGGGIYTKAADVGADLVGKVEAGIPEDDPRNPAVIADNVGDNVGDIAGMGADLFGSLAEATCACLVISSVSGEIKTSWGALMFPLTLSAVGILGCMLTAYFATDFPKLQVKQASHVERNLKYQILISTAVLTPLVLIVAYASLPSTFCAQVLAEARIVQITAGIPGEIRLCGKYASPGGAVICILAGLWSGLVVGFWTEYMTSYSYKPVKDIAEASKYGAGPNIIFGLAAGYKSVTVPTFALALTIFIAFKIADMYGISLAALGMLSTLATGLSIDAYGPITDNAGGVAEMAGLPPSARVKTDVLDAAGNTTAAIGKGFAIGSAALVSLALFGAFVTRVHMNGVDILKPLTFAGLLIGAMLPFWFSAMTIRAVGDAATEMVTEVRQQFADGEILAGRREPDYKRCVQISTDASLKQMIAPGALVMFSPIIAGSIFGVGAVSGMLAGALVSGVQVAISSSNSGGAWDNAKKYLEKEGLKKTDQHKAAVVGGTLLLAFIHLSRQGTNPIQSYAFESIPFFFLSCSLSYTMDE